jgi:hypothetical protein
MATIDQFKSFLDGGGARANQFRVTLTTPTGIATGLSGVLERASFLIKTASLPGQTITDIPVNYRGRILYLAGDRTFEPWTTTVLNDTDFAIRNGVEQWMSGINDLETSIGVTNVSQYTADLLVEQLDREENTLKSYTLRGCWPTAVNAIELNMDTVSDVETFDITWRYTYFSASAV